MLFTTPEQFVVLAMLLVGGWLLGYASAPGTRKWKRRVREQSDSFTAYHAEAEDRLAKAKRREAELKAVADALRADHAAAERTIADLRAAAVTVPAAAGVESEPEHPPLAVAEPVPHAVADVEHIEAAHAVEDTAPEPELAAEQEHHAEDTTPEPAAPEPVRHEIVEVVEPVAIVPMTPTPSEAAPAAIGPAEPEMPSKGWFASSARDELTRIRGIDAPLNTRLFGLGVTRFEDLEKLSAEDEMALEQRLVLPVGYIAREQWRTQAALLRAGQDEEHAAHFGAVEVNA